MTRTRVAILTTTLLSFSTLYACGGGSKEAQEPAPAPAPEPEPPTAEAEPPPEEPAEPPPPAEPPGPEPKTLSEDLDGDGTPEEISLTGTELKIGEATATLATDKITPEKAETIELKVIDINKKDKSRELVIVDAGAEGVATWWIVSFDAAGKTISEPVEVAVTGEPEIKGNGKLVTKAENCGETTTTTYAMKKGVLGKGKEKKKGKYSEAKCPG